MSANDPCSSDGNITHSPYFDGTFIWFTHGGDVSGFPTVRYGRVDTGNNTVVFFELFNEPSNYSDQGGPVSWDQWKKLNEDLVIMIHAFDRSKIPIVAGFDWAYDLTPLHNGALNVEGVAYSVHPYVFKRSKPWEPKWDEDFGFAADRFPVVATEFGFWTPEKPNPAGHCEVSRKPRNQLVLLGL